MQKSLFSKQPLNPKRDLERYRLLIPKRFVVNTDISPVEVHLTSHLFVPRRGASRRRAFMFKSTWQFVDILDTAFSKYDLFSYADKGRVVFVFSYLGEEYGMLMDLERKLDDDGYILTVITVDKKEDRHYTKVDMFHREINKIYSKYELPYSYMLSVGTRIDRVRGMFEAYRTRHFETLFDFDFFKKTVDETRIVNSLVSRIEKEDLNYGIYWIRVAYEPEKHIYVKISLERIIRSGKNIVVVIFVDLKRNKEGVDAVKEASEGYFELDRGANGELFGRRSSIKRFAPKRTGLRIKRKIEKK